MSAVQWQHFQRLAPRPLLSEIEGHAAEALAPSTLVTAEMVRPHLAKLAQAEQSKGQRLMRMLEAAPLAALAQGNEPSPALASIVAVLAQQPSAMASEGARRVDYAKIQRTASFQALPSWVKSLALSPDGRRVVVGGNHTSVRSFDLQSHALLSELVGHTAPVTCVRMSKDGAALATASGKRVQRWDAQTQQALGPPLEEHAGVVRSLAFSPDALTLATAADDQAVLLWDATTGKMTGKTLIGHTRLLTSVVFSPDGKTLASASMDNSMRLWDVGTGKVKGPRLSGHTGSVQAIAFSPDGRTLASASWDGTLRLWDVETGQPKGAPLFVGEGKLSSVAFSPDGQVIAWGSENKSVRICDAHTGEAIGEPMQDEAAVNALAFSADGRCLVSGAENGEVSVRHFG